MNFLSYKGLKQQNICTTFVFRSKIFGLFCTYSYLCKRSLAQCSSVNAGVTFVGKKEISVCCLFNNVRETWRWKERGHRVTVDAHVMWALLHLLSQVSAKYLRTRCGSRCPLFVSTGAWRKLLLIESYSACLTLMMPPSLNS